MYKVKWLPLVYEINQFYGFLVAIVNNRVYILCATDKFYQHIYSQQTQVLSSNASTVKEKGIKAHEYSMKSKWSNKIIKMLFSKAINY
jgi:hypothetical protein